MRKLLRVIVATGVGTVLASAASMTSAADPAQIDWTRISSVPVALFYPGQTSHEWLLSAQHPGASSVKSNVACVTCHNGGEAKLGNKLVKAGPLEPVPVKDKVGTVDLGVQAAYDATNLYLRFQWKTQMPYPGTEHQYLRYDGHEWKVYGYPKLDKVVQDGNQPGIYEDRMTIMIDDGKVAGFATQGCWLTCHEGQRDMPKQFTADQVKANPLLTALKKSDVRKYLPETRTDSADWQTGKSTADIDKLKTDGYFVDLIQWRAHRSNAVGMVDDGYVLEFRNSDAGADMFAGNADAKTHQPKYMWDDKKMGYRSITVDRLRKGNNFLLPGENAVPFDPNAGWKEGDLIPDYIVSRALAKGSAADNNGIATWKDGTWTVVMIRPLGLANADDKLLKEGGVYNVGFAVHDDNITTRGHHVSFVRTLGIGAKGAITAVKLP